MHRGLPSVETLGTKVIGSSELGFGASVNSTNLAWASVITSSGSWISSYVPSTSEVVSI